VWVVLFLPTLFLSLVGEGSPRTCYITAFGIDYSEGGSSVIHNFLLLFTVAVDNPKMSAPTTTKELILHLRDNGEYSEQEAEILIHIWGEVKVR
jgi:hypothetical protein